MKKNTKKTKKQLLTILKKLDGARAKTIDINNPVRLIRAIEIARAPSATIINSAVGKIRFLLAMINLSPGMYFPKRSNRK